MSDLKSNHPYHQISEDAVALHVSAAEAGAVVGAIGTVAAKIPEDVRAAILVLDVTAAATDVGDLLDVAVETLVGAHPADPANSIAAYAGEWVQVCAFVQHLGTGGAARYIDKLVAALDQADFTDADLAAGAKRHLFGSQWRCVWTITDAGIANASFTFAVHLQPC